MFYLLFIFMLINAINSISAHPEACLLRCKDNYMHEMQSLLNEDAPEWSLNLVTPLQSLFHNSNHEDIYKRINLTCETHSHFMECLKGCQESRARSIVELGQTNWAFICESLKSNREFHTTILPCWTHHGEFISAQCHYHAIFLQNAVIEILQNGWSEPSSSLDELCRTLAIYDKCFFTFSDKVCGKKGWEFLLKLNTKNSDALIRMLVDNIDLKSLPVVCDHWKHPEEYAQWHVKRITGARNSLSSQKFPTTFIIFIAYFSINL